MQLHDQLARAEFVSLGGDLRGYYAAPAGAGPFPAVLLFQEAFGVNDYIQSEVRRLAQHGFAALAPDLFRGDTYDYTTHMNEAIGRLKTLKDDAMLADVDACTAFLAKQPEVKAGKLGAVGFCMGGRLAFLTATARAAKIAGAAAFYGGDISTEEGRNFKPLTDRAPQLSGELMLIYGAEDGSIDPQQHARIAEALSTNKKNYTLRVFPDAGHGFASRDRDSYRPAQAEEAWTEVLALLNRTLR